MATTSAPPAPAVDERLLRTSPVRKLLVRPEMGALFGAIAVWLYFAIVAHNRGFLTAFGASTYLEVSAQLGILATTVALLMIGGEFDLSIGSMLGATGMIAAILSTNYHWNLFAAMLIALVFALIVGALNGVVVVVTNLPSFITTLATLFIIRGATIGFTRRITGLTNVGGMSDAPGYDLANHIFGYRVPLGGNTYPISIVWWIGLTVVATWILLRTSFGNWIFGVGGNIQAARNVGVPTNTVKIVLYMMTAFSAWLVAMIQLVLATGTDVLRGSNQELYAIIAVVIGGTLLTGGYGSAIGAGLGALIYGMVRQGIFFAGYDSDWFQVVVGAMLLIAVLINQFVRLRAAGAKR
jgi:simple sugar transport system permease protein